MAIEKKSLIDTRASAKKAVVASKAAATPGHTVVAPRKNMNLKRSSFKSLRATRSAGTRG